MHQLTYAHGKFCHIHPDIYVCVTQRCRHAVLCNPPCSYSLCVLPQSTARSWWYCYSDTFCMCICSISASSHAAFLFFWRFHNSTANMYTDNMITTPLKSTWASHMYGIAEYDKQPHANCACTSAKVSAYQIHSCMGCLPKAVLLNAN